MRKSKTKSGFYTIAIPAILLCITWLIFGIGFDGNDDQDLRNLIAGYVSGQPEYAVPYMGFLYSGLIALCYRLCGVVSWYTVIYMGTIWLACIGIFRAVIKADRSQEKKLGRAGQAAFFACIYVSCILYSTVFMQYSTQSGILGAAAVATLLSEDKNYTKITHEKNVRWGVILFLLAVNIRVNMGYIVAAVMCATWVLQIVRRRLDFKMALSWLFAILAIVMVSISLNNSFGNQSTDWESFNEYNHGRTQFSDYGHPEYEGNEELYENLGWDSTLYYIVGDWYYMDSRVDSDAFNQIYEYRKVNQLDVLGKKAIISMALPYVYGNRVIRTGFIISLFLLVLASISIKENIWRGIGICSYVVGLYAILFYLATDFRMTNWVARGIMILCIVPAVILMMQREKQEKYSNKLLLIFVIGIGIFCLESCILFAQKGTNGFGTHAWDRRTTTVEEYARDHEGNVYVNANFSLAANPWEIYSEVQAPTNLIAYGGWNMKSPIYYRQLEANNIQEGNFQWLTKDNVYLMFYGEVSDFMKMYLESRYPNAKLTVTDQVGGIYIYKLR